MSLSSKFELDPTTNELVCCNHGCVEDVVIFYGKLFVVTSLWQIGKFNLRSGNLVFSTLTYEPHYLTRKIRLVASKEQLFVVNLTIICAVCMQ
ncbi:hypothetical protein Pint_31195 [Pistacia integerrima]|uniref:Uncharacterized protein n=1 Tax=Pistacia integerrima TaxID=434235 RepID=A0ACC0XPR7_9ROSI|nr:hypothetical protein Pint_31195 [Pistacia integerrima]